MRFGVIEDGYTGRGLRLRARLGAPSPHALMGSGLQQPARELGGKQQP
jgi:hypothetical protein